MKKESTLVYLISLLALAIVILSVLLLDHRFSPSHAVMGRVSASKRQVIVLDAGHGGFDGGAVGKDGTVEKDINLAITLKLRHFLELAGFEVVMTRTEDISIHSDDTVSTRQKKSSDLHNRLDMVEQIPGAALLSIHQNKFSEAGCCGTQVFYGPKNPQSVLFADSIQSTVVSLLQPDNTRLSKKSGDSIYILYYAESPAVLVECGFLSNPEERDKLKSDDYQGQMAFAILCGTLEYFGAADQTPDVPMTESQTSGG